MGACQPWGHGPGGLAAPAGRGLTGPLRSGKAAAAGLGAEPGGSRAGPSWPPLAHPPGLGRDVLPGHAPARSRHTACPRPLWRPAAPRACGELLPAPLRHHLCPPRRDGVGGCARAASWLPSPVLALTLWFPVPSASRGWRRRCHRCCDGGQDVMLRPQLPPADPFLHCHPTVLLILV